MGRVSLPQSMAASVEDAIWSAAAETQDQSAIRAAELQRRRKELARQRAALSQEIKNEERKRKRRLERARALSDSDLVNVIAARAAAKAKAQAKAAA